MNKFTEQDLRLMKALYNNGDGMKQRDIAKKFDCSDMTVYYWIKKDFQKPSRNKNISVSEFLKLKKLNKKLEDKNILLQEENEKLKREIAAVCSIDYGASNVPAYKRRIYDLEETIENMKNMLIQSSAFLSSVKYTEYK